MPMAASLQARIEKVGFYEPQRNLPHFQPRATGERTLTLRFAKAYRSRFLFLHRPSANDSIAIAREIPANGYGVADLVAVTWRARRKSTRLLDVFQFTQRLNPTIRAF